VEEEKHKNGCIHRSGKRGKSVKGRRLVKKPKEHGMINHQQHIEEDKK
jgi:hypothetical protein